MLPDNFQSGRRIDPWSIGEEYNVFIKRDGILCCRSSIFGIQEIIQIVRAGYHTDIQYR